MTVKYHCSHLSDHSSPYPPSYPSSSSSFNPLGQLYFCEECDAVRCDLCCVTEIASYFCPNCTFDVPSANVRGDKNRCARNCFSCPECTTPLQVQAMGMSDGAGPSSPTGPPFLLVCTSCRWSSREVGLEFDKSTGLALQVQKLLSSKDRSQPEFDALKDHLDSYISTPTPTITPARPGSRLPTRHISHLTQMAAKALHRDVPGMAASGGGFAKSGLRREIKGGGDKVGWDELGEYKVKESWGMRGLEIGMGDVERMRRLQDGDIGRRQGRDVESWYEEPSKGLWPERIPLQTKLTKRCPHPNCRHLLIQPDTKSTRFKIKMVAGNYMPSVEIGRRRRRVDLGEIEEQATEEELERRRRERRKGKGRGEEVEEDMDMPLRAGQVYTFQLAFTNPLFDPIQVRLTQPTQPPPLFPPNHHLHIPTPHFLVNPSKDAWAYEEEPDEYPDIDATEGGTSEDGSSALAGLGSSRGTLSAGTGTVGKRSRLSVLNTTSSVGLREKERRKKEGEVEKKGNCSKVGLELELLPGASGKLIFDLEVRFTYRAEDPTTEAQEESKKSKKGKDEYKHFTFWVRIDLGQVDSSSSSS